MRKSRRVWRPAGFCLLTALSVLASLCAAQSVGNTHGKARDEQLQHQIKLTKGVMAHVTNETQKAEWRQRLLLLEEDLDSLTRRRELEQREEALAHKRRMDSTHALHEALCGVEVDEKTPRKQARSLSSRIFELRASRVNLEDELDNLHENAEANSRRIAEIDEIIRNADQEVLMCSLQRGVAELSLRLIREAERIDERVRGMPINPPPTIRTIVQKRRYLLGEQKLSKDMSTRIQALKERRKELTSSLVLAKAKFTQISEEIDLIRRKQRIQRKRELVLPWLVAANEKRLKELQEERVASREEQVRAAGSSLDLAIQMRDLYDKEVAVLKEDLAVLVRRYWVSILVPCSSVTGIILLYILLSALALPRLYSKDRLFVARRLSGYVAFLLIILVLCAFFLEDLKAIATVLGIAGAALVIALQDLCSAFAGWFVIVVSRKVRVGDRVEIDGHCGDVIDVQLLRITLLELNNWLGVDEPTGRVMVIPNSFIFKSKVLNYSHVHPYVWSRVDVTVTFETPAQEAHDVLLRILQEESRDEFDSAVRAASDMEHKYGTPDTVYKPKIYSVIVDSGVMFCLLYVSHYRRRVAVRNRINERIIAEFDRNPRLNFAYPTQRHIPTAERGAFHVTVGGEEGR